MTSEPGTIGWRLRRARLAHGLSLDELVERLDRCVTKAALSKYELGQITPSPTVLQKLGRALRVPTSHFLPDQEDEDARITWLAYRKHSKLGKRQQDRIRATAEHRAETYLHLLRFLRPGEEPRFPERRPAASDEDAENAADALRRRWELGSGPLEHLVQHIEDAGALVVESPEDDRFEALSGRTRTGIPVISLNLSRPADRLRFSVAHELGHLLLECSGVEAKEEEQLAHRFAAAFLVPAEAARRELGPRRTQITQAELEQLKVKYGFSMQAWTRRARDLGILTEATYRSWQIWFRSQHVHVNETATYQGDERPRRLALLCLQGLAEKVVDAEWVRSHCPEIAQEMPEATTGKESLVRQLLRLQPEQRRPILEASANKTASDYEQDPEVQEWLEIDDLVEPEKEPH